MECLKRIVRGYPRIRTLDVSGWHVKEILQLEESLFRGSSSNWLVLGAGVATPTIVLGVSGKIEEMVDTAVAQALQVEIVKRFTGGGTVVVDSDTVLASLILNTAVLPDSVSPFPREIMRWSADLYRPFFHSINKTFDLVETDYAFGNMKFGGNAQAVSRNRFVHHTSFLWNYRMDYMNSLREPTRRPAYRGVRSHDGFLISLREAMRSQAAEISDDVVNIPTVAGREPYKILSKATGLDAKPDAICEGLKWAVYQQFDSLGDEAQAMSLAKEIRRQYTGRIGTFSLNLDGSPL